MTDFDPEDPPIYCGLGCQCLAQCGDFYDFHRYQKPPENEEFVDAARTAGKMGAATSEDIAGG